MAILRWISFFFVLFCIAPTLEASEGDADPLYRDCVEHCEKTGCVGSQCFQNCQFTADGNISDGRWYLQEPLYLKWKHWDCRSDCRYNCMLAREEERKSLGEKPVKYHGRWPFRRVYGIQEPVSVALSTLNLAIQFHGWMSFFILVYYKLPLKNRRTYYEFTGLCHIYGVLAMNSWFWTAVFHGRDLDLAEKLYYSSSAALIGFGLLLSIFRVFSVNKEATRVMVASDPQDGSGSHFPDPKVVPTLKRTALEKQYLLLAGYTFVIPEADTTVKEPPAECIVVYRELLTTVSDSPFTR